MVRHRVLLLRAALLAADAAAASVLFAVVSMVRFGDPWRDAWTAAGPAWWVWAAAYGLIWAAAEWLLELDRLRARWTMQGEAFAILRATALVGVTVFALLFLVHVPQVSRQFLVMLFVAQLAFSVVQRRFLRLVLVLGRRQGIGVRHVLVLGTGPDARRLADRLERHPALGYQVLGHLGKEREVGRRILGPLERVDVIVHEEIVDEVAAALADDEVEYLEPVTTLCQQEGKLLRILLRPGVVPAGTGHIESLDGLQILTISNGPDRILSLIVKRLLDIFLGGLALVVLSPVILVAAIVIKASDGGPVFFSQTRVGLHGRSFRMVKLRTMAVDAEARLAELAAFNVVNGHAFKVEDDPRITRVGGFLRRTSLDEVPQFWNVVLGEMSIVGPRPPLPDEVAGYDLWHRRRLSMKPGITGLWQVSARLEQEFDRWVELDLDYIDRWSLWLDFKIMVRTVPAMLSGR